MYPRNDQIKKTINWSSYGCIEDGSWYTCMLKIYGARGDWSCMPDMYLERYKKVKHKLHDKYD